MRIILNGPPISKLRPRFAKGKVFDIQEREKNFIKLLMKKKLKELYESDEQEDRVDVIGLATANAFDVRFVFSLPIARSSSKRLKNAKLSGLMHCTKKPDLDNLIKFYLDCANGILFEDDRYIVSLSAKKVYGEKAQTEMIILPAK